MILKIEMLIKQIREQKNISLRELSRRTGISDSHLSNIERGEKETVLSKLLMIADALDVEITDIFKRKN